MPGRINGFSLAYTATGGVILWSGIKGTTISSTFRGLLSGQAPTTDQEQISNGAALQADTSSGTSIPGVTVGIPAGVAAPTGSNEAILKQVAAQHGWTGSEWTALYNVEMREAGFSLTATNPSSGAYGMAQFIDGPSEYAQYGGNSTSALGQSVAMCNYIEQRYGTPSAAWAHEQQYGWY